MTWTRGPGSPALVLSGTIAAAMLVMANVAVLNVALPELSVELGASQAQGQWMVDIYSVVLASLLMPVGAIGDRFGRRSILLFGLFVLAGANGATVWLDTPGQVIAARAVSGIGAAFVFPATLSTITATLPDELRSRGIAMWTAAVSVGGFLGILGAGLLIENFWWGSIFLAMAAAAGAVLVFCVVTVPDSSDPADSNLDPVGGLLALIGFGGLVLGIIEGPVGGWSSPLAAGGLFVGAAALLMFAGWEWVNPRPLLDVRMFARPGVRAGSLSVFVQFIGAFGLFFVIVFYLSVVRGSSALEIGLALVPISLTLLPASALALPLARRFGRRSVGVTGIAIMACGCASGLMIGVDTGFGPVLLTLLIIGLGYGLAGPPATEAIVESLPAANQGVASALNDVLRELGAAIGIAIAGSAFNSAYRSSVGDISGVPAEVVEAVKESPFVAAQLAPDLGDQAPVLLGGVDQAVVDGWRFAMGTVAAVLGLGAVGFVLWAPGRRSVAAAGLLTDDELVLVDEPGPLGAIELAAHAEGDLAKLAAGVNEISDALVLLRARSRVPDDMGSWPAIEQVKVAERAAVAMEGTLDELSTLADLTMGSAVACDASVVAARAELVRLGRDPRQLATMDGLVRELSSAMAGVAHEAQLIDERFADLSALMSTLRPAARQVAAVAATIGRLRKLVDSWAGQVSRDARQAPGRRAGHH